jgi:hypothetical protein
MSVGEEQDENGGAPCERTVIPLRRWRRVRSEAIQGLLLES